MKKLLGIILVALILAGCASSNEPEISGSYTLNYFYVEGCPRCEDFVEYGIPAIEAAFGDHLTINQYDLDATETKAVYDDTIDQLDGFDQENYGYGPLMSLDGYFAKLGYSYGDEDELISDMIKAIDGDDLGDELIAGRYYFIQ